MAVTAIQVLELARRQIHDEQTDRWENVDLLAYLNEAMRVLDKHMPELRMGTAGSLTALADITEENSTLAFDEYWRLPLADYIAHLCMTEEDPDRHDAAKAQFHMSRFLVAVGKG